MPNLAEPVQVEWSTRWDVHNVPKQAVLDVNTVVALRSKLRATA